MASASSAQNERFILAQRPKGLPNNDTFKRESIDTPKLEKDGTILVKLTHISVDPYLRGKIAGDSMKEGDVMVSGVAGEVAESKNDKYPVGTKVWWYGQWQRVQVVDPAQAEKAAQLSKIGDEAPPSASLGVLGMPGATAYFGLKFAAEFKKGDVVLVSGAAGAVGSAVGQLAKLWGAKLVVGSAGGSEKCKYVTETLGFDAAIDYKKFDTAEKVAAELKRLSPDGFDVYFDNTGGHVADAFYPNARKFARVALCGQISQYNNDKTEVIPNPFMKCIYTSVRIQGFIQSDYISHWGEFQKEMGAFVHDKKVKYQETIVKGFDKTPEAFTGLFHGHNTGKMIVQV